MLPEILIRVPIAAIRSLRVIVTRLSLCSSLGICDWGRCTWPAKIRRLDAVSSSAGLGPHKQLFESADLGAQQGPTDPGTIAGGCSSPAAACMALIIASCAQMFGSRYEVDSPFQAKAIQRLEVVAVYAGARAPRAERLRGARLPRPW